MINLHLAKVNLRSLFQVVRWANTSSNAFWRTLYNKKMWLSRTEAEFAVYNGWNMLDSWYGLALASCLCWYCTIYVEPLAARNDIYLHAYIDILFPTFTFRGTCNLSYPFSNLRKATTAAVQWLQTLAKPSGMYDLRSICMAMYCFLVTRTSTTCF